jgi:hypothetical protein
VKGRINFGANSHWIYPFDLVTWWDSDYAKTAASEDNRPSFDAGDVASGLDAEGSFYERAKNAYRVYINSLPDGKSQILDVSAQSVRSTVPVLAPSVALSNGPSWTAGLGAPTGKCETGSLYSRRDGVAGKTLFVCEAGVWPAMPSVAIRGPSKTLPPAKRPAAPGHK